MAIIMRMRDKYNSSGCLDMTAYLAIQRLEDRDAKANTHKEHKQKKRIISKSENSNGKSKACGN